jgi:hypothetical protein
MDFVCLKSNQRVSFHGWKDMMNYLYHMHGPYCTFRVDTIGTVWYDGVNVGHFPA